MKQHTFSGSPGKVVLTANLSLLTARGDPAVGEELAPCFLFCCAMVFCAEPSNSGECGLFSGSIYLAIVANKHPQNDSAKDENSRA